MAGREIRAKAQIIAAYLLEVHDDLGWDVDRFRVKGVPEMAELAFAAYNNVPPGMEPGLEAVSRGVFTSIARLGWTRCSSRKSSLFPFFPLLNGTRRASESRRAAILV